MGNEICFLYIAEIEDSTDEEVVTGIRGHCPTADDLCGE